MQHSAELEISIEELAAWAITHTRIRTLVDDAPADASELGLRRALEVNPHLRDVLARAFARAHPERLLEHRTSEDRTPPKRNRRNLSRRSARASASPESILDPAVKGQPDD